MYRLLAHPENIEPLRQEVDAVIREEGWTKAGIDKMYKIDSFLRETQRLDGLGLRSLHSLSRVKMLTLRFPVPLIRLALRPFTFSNGVTIPAGTLIAVPGSAVHTDEANFHDPDTFDGFRFAKFRENEGDTTTNRYQTVSTSSEHLAFGLGRNTWYEFLQCGI